MADINSNKNAIIIQPITLQIRAPFQLLTNQRAIKHTHYSESRDGLNGRCSFSVVCVARQYTLQGSSVRSRPCYLFEPSYLGSFAAFAPRHLGLSKVIWSNMKKRLFVKDSNDAIYCIAHAQYHQSQD